MSLRLVHTSSFASSRPAARQILSGNEAIALAALHAGVRLGAGYPGTPSTEILEAFGALGGRAQWAPNEKVAMEVTLGASFAGARTLTTMKHVGLNVASDVLFTASQTDIPGAMVVVSADDPGMASSQNEQDNRRYAVAAGVPMFEPADSQEAYDFTLAAVALAERWRMPALVRVTTRICHSKTAVEPRPAAAPPAEPHYERNIRERVMIPAHARPAHRKLRAKLAEIAAWGEEHGLHQEHHAGAGPGIVTSGVCYMHAREAAPDHAILKLGLTHPLPLGRIRAFVAAHPDCTVIEEGDPYLAEALRAAGLAVKSRPEPYRFGELNVERIRRILAGDGTPEAPPPAGRPPRLCPACPHRNVFEVLNKLGCIVAGDIGCYTLGALPPFEAMDMMICMGAAIGMGLGLRHVLPADEARRVVSVLGDSTFIHGGLPGVAEMVYNPPPDGHVLIILDNETTAMTGQQEHPGTGRRLDHSPARRLVMEDVVRAMGVPHVDVVDPLKHQDRFEELVQAALGRRELSVIVARRPCILLAGRAREAAASGGSDAG